jgi:hypothetical protein
VQVPATELRVRVHSARDHTPCDASLFVADQCVQIAGERIVPHLPPGAHRVFVTAPGHQTAVCTVVVPDAGRVELRVVLPLL